MAISETRARTSNSLGGEHQVFLNFRGLDTRRGFTDTLHLALLEAGIHVYIDDKSVRQGERIDGELLQAIDDSRLYILIFSKNYASSHWCLRELARIMKNTSESKDGNKKVILPIFYDDVTPDVVKLKTGQYKEDILALKEKRKLSTEEVKEWVYALSEVDATMGYEKKKYPGDGHLSKIVVEEVVKRLGIKHRKVTEDLVGMEDQIAAINNLLRIDSGDDSGSKYNSDSEYDVFLNFRGPDTRRGFTDVLYHFLTEAMIRVFKGDETLQLGESIGGKILRAIDYSRLYIPIFSRNYASSRWCLCELARMVENFSKPTEDGNKKVILPIFYDVSRLDVKLETDLYCKHLEIHRGEFSSADIEIWKQALRRVGDIRGFDLQKYTGHGHLVKSVVEEVVYRLQRRQRKVTKDVQLIGIHGMTGIGKSTLAKIIFNEQYPKFKKYCSFLDDVSKTAKTKGLVELQKLLLSDMSNSRVARNIEKIDHGTDIIGETICNKKALIVLDDVDDVNQIQELIGTNFLCPGTRILVTTRDKRVLNIRGFKYEIVLYDMKGLSDKNALQLFSRHAFDEDSPRADYDTLSKDIVSTAGGLPLAIEAIGSSLFLQKEKKIWEEMLEKLRKTPHGDVLEKLRITYDALKMDQQQIFLDVACFFISWNKIDPLYMWKDCGFSPEYAIDVLINRCMIKVTDDNRFWMHNQFRDFGRAITTQEHSRLWARDDIICELKSTEIKRSVQALCLQSDLSAQPPLTVTLEQIERFPHLRFLWFSDVTCQGDFTGCLSKLKWISVCYPGIYPFLQHQHHPRGEATNSHLENVVVVNLFGLGFTDDEVGSLIKETRKLKVLTLQESDLQTLEPLSSNSTVLELTSTRVKQLPLDGLARLEKLIVEGCKLLERLTIIGCESLQVVVGIGELEHLQWLKVKGCRSMERIIDASSSKIPNKCEISITDCGKLLDTGQDGSSIAWESYREKILKRPIRGRL